MGKNKKVKEIEIYLQIKEYLDMEKIDIFVKDFVKNMDGSPKFELNHSYDPEYDCSGELENVGTININEYDTLGQLLDEYDGQRYPSGISGMGWSNETYESSFDELMIELIFDFDNYKDPQYVRDLILKKYSNEIDIGENNDEEYIDELIREFFIEEVCNFNLSINDDYLYKNIKDLLIV